MNLVKNSGNQKSYDTYAPTGQVHVAKPSGDAST